MESKRGLHMDLEELATDVDCLTEKLLESGNKSLAIVNGVYRDLLTAKMK